MTKTRSHFLGSCHTCRRRHVRCDRRRPSCSKCCALGVTCEGFSDKVRWVPYNGDNSNKSNINAIDDTRQGMRRHLYSEESRLSMNMTLGANLVSGSIDASLAEIERRSQNLRQTASDDLVVGPFSVLNFQAESRETSQSSLIEEPDRGPGLNDDDTLTAAPASTTVAAETPTVHPVAPLTDSLGYMDDFLHWSDILDLGFDNTDFSTWPNSTTLDPFHFGAQDLNLSSTSIDSECLDIEIGTISCEQPSLSDRQHLTWAPASGQTAVETPSTTLDILADAPFLLQNLQNNMIPLMVAMPFGLKSPWTTLNLPAAVTTLGDLTFLNSQNITHARLANLYSLLACSAIYLTLKPSNNVGHSIDHWRQFTNQAFDQAKEEMQLSLKNETQMPKKAKYKDQLMALCALTEFAIISGQSQHARCFLLDTERLVRLRGFLKRKISQKARLLHHVYTWLRIVGESTYVLHDYNPSQAFLDALRANFQHTRPLAEPGSARYTEHPHARLDNFLRLETHTSDRDLNIDERKDQETSLRDIHLEDSREYPETLYKQIYGIPETWLSLVSQTTRLANVMETFQNARGSISDLSFEAWDTLQRRSVRLEYMICSLNSTRNRNSDQGDETSKPRHHMLRALNAALVIFFYRRIRQVHPQILERHVDDVISNLEQFRAAFPQNEPIGLGSIWPAFIAGCEATDSTRRDAIVQWLDRAYASCQFTPLSTAKVIMAALWRKQDECLTVRRELITTWIDIARQQRIWPMLC